MEYEPGTYIDNFECGQKNFEYGVTQTNRIAVHSGH